MREADWPSQLVRERTDHHFLQLAGVERKGMTREQIETQLTGGHWTRANFAKWACESTRRAVSELTHLRAGVLLEQLRLDRSAMSSKDYARRRDMQRCIEQSVDSSNRVVPHVGQIGRRVARTTRATRQGAAAQRAEDEKKHEDNGGTDKKTILALKRQCLPLEFPLSEAQAEAEDDGKRTPDMMIQGQMELRERQQKHHRLCLSVEPYVRFFLNKQFRNSQQQRFRYETEYKKVGVRACVRAAAGRACMCLYL